MACCFNPPLTHCGSKAGYFSVFVYIGLVGQEPTVSSSKVRENRARNDTN